MHRYEEERLLADVAAIRRALDEQADLPDKVTIKFRDDVAEIQYDGSTDIQSLTGGMFLMTGRGQMIVVARDVAGCQAVLDKWFPAGGRTGVAS